MKKEKKWSRARFEANQLKKAGGDKKLANAMCYSFKPMANEEHFTFVLLDEIRERLLLFQHLNLPQYSKEMRLNKYDRVALDYRNTRAMNFKRAMTLFLRLKKIEAKHKPDIWKLVDATLRNLAEQIRATIHKLKIRETKDMSMSHHTLEFTGFIISTDVTVSSLPIFRFRTESDLNKFLRSTCNKLVDHNSRYILHVLPIEGRNNRSSIQISWRGGNSAIEKAVWINSPKSWDEGIVTGGHFASYPKKGGVMLNLRNAYYSKKPIKIHPTRRHILVADE